jgi:hypothetical protein
MDCKNARSGKFTNTVNCVKHSALHFHANDSSCSFGPTQYPLYAVRCQDMRALCVYHTRKADAVAYFKISPQNVPKITEVNHNSTSEHADAGGRV